MLTKNLKIRNSTTEFLMFTSDNKQDSIEVKVVDENVWLTQKLISGLFGKSRSTVTEHLKNIFNENKCFSQTLFGKKNQTKFIVDGLDLSNITDKDSIRKSEDDFISRIKNLIKQ